VPVKTKAKTLSGVAENLYIQLASLSQNITESYRIPYQHVIELGIRYGI
jgi:K+ transporter